MILEKILMAIAAAPATGIDTKVGVEVQEGIVTYDVGAVEDYMKDFLQGHGIVSLTHVRYYDVAVSAAVEKKYFGRNLVATLAKKELLFLAPVLWPLGAVYIDREGSFEHKRNVLGNAVKRGFPYLGNFHNKSTKRHKQDIGIATAEWSAIYGLPVVPVGFHYPGKDRGLFARPSEALMVFGCPIPKISRSDLDFEGDVLLRTDNNKAVMKLYVANIMKKTYDFFNAEYPSFLDI